MGGLERRLQRLGASIGEDDRQAQNEIDWAVVNTIATDPEARRLSNKILAAVADGDEEQATALSATLWERIRWVS